MAFQDDARELELIKIFNLKKPDNAARHGTDAVIKVGTKNIEFELKSAPDGKSVTTARDVGFDHLTKWKTRHWIVGIYKNGKFSYAYYMPPRVLKGWIKSKEEYILNDYKLSEILKTRLTINDLYLLIGNKKQYSYEDAKKIQKLQYNKKKYNDLMDIKNGYSPKRMLEILQDRAEYLIQRGYTLNNPHIPVSVVQSGHKITKNFPKELLKFLKKEI